MVEARKPNENEGSSGKTNETKRSPIQNLCFESNGDDHKATILLSKKVYIDNIYLMRNENPENINGYVVDKVIKKKDYKFEGNDIEVNLSELDLDKDNKIAYSFKIDEYGGSFQSEAFKYDKKDNKFKLVREIKGGFLGFSWTTILYVGLVVIGVLICLFILMKIMNR
ncbi:hypothetical protein CWI39_0637p0020 [Hamiltosporidium magnivora]|uniref:Uncharacterized protein n=1 Tax=Hamiltosporidium magnivora TaxID=148818 RepID=A0A4Q9LDS8_9MICR|nr:hypothetical protein CWI39_0637p0020 [Hamiltosporidium magnivora]